MTRVWKAGGKELYDDQIPFEKGTDQYYRYVAEWRARALGIDYNAPPNIQDRGKWDQGVKDWQSKYFWETKGMDRGGQNPAGYISAMNPATGRYEWVYDVNRDGAYTRGSENFGKYDNPAMAADNSWNELEGIDPRSDEQKFYDRDMTNFSQMADENGTYHWYGDWSYRDGNGSTQKKRIDLSYLGDRDAKGKGEDPYGAGPDYTRDSTKDKWGGKNYWEYNGAPEKGWFDDAISKRPNLSRWARTY